MAALSETLRASAEQMRGLEDAAEAQAHAWVEASGEMPADPAAARLAALLRDPDGLEFTVRFIDRVVRPEDVHVAARELRALSRRVPTFLSWPLRAGMRLAGAFAPMVPRMVVPAARRVLRTLVRHLIVDARPRHLTRAMRAIRRGPGEVRLNLNLLGEAVLGSAEAERRLAGTAALIEREDVDYVSIKVSSTVAPHSPWAFKHAVDQAVNALRPLYRAALTSPGGPTFINLDMEEYRDLRLTLAVFMRVLDEPELADAHAGVVLQAYLPDALGAMVEVQDWAARRVQAGGAPVKVRVVKGANLPMERVDADLHGWPLATWNSKTATDANYKAILGYALDPERVQNVRIGVAGHNLFDLALAWELAGVRGVREALDVEMLLGMAPQQAAAVRQTVGRTLLYTPTVSPREFDVAIAYLVRRLDEGSASENFMSAAFDLDDDALFARERERFRAALREIPIDLPEPARVQDRRAAISDAAGAPAGDFTNAPDSDPATAANTAWAAAMLEAMPSCTHGEKTWAAGWLDNRAALDALMETTASAGEAWGRVPAAERAAVLRRAADELERRRTALIEIAGHECGKVIDQSDPEVSEAIDFARYYAGCAAALDSTEGATFVPRHLTVVTPPWNFPVAIPAGGMLAALAAGSAVVVKPAEEAARCSAVVVEALWAAGVPREALQYVRVDEGELGSHLIAHRLTDQVILTGAYETAELFLGFNPRMRLLAETSGKNAIIVTPSADLDLAAKDVAASAFGHAGQKCSAASLVVLVGSVASSPRFRSQVLDAVRSMRVGWPEEAATQMGPLIAPAGGKLLDALTALEAGQEWLVQPRRLDEDGKLWTPGIRTGVKPGSAFHLTEYFGPVLGIMEAASLDDAIDMVNAVDYGLTSGLHSLDDHEIQRWMARVEAGNLYVNRSITGAIVQRQPFGGWKRSAVGPGAKAGGPHYLAALGQWSDAPVISAPPADDALVQEAQTLTGSLPRGAEDVDWLQRAWGSDAREWQRRRGVVTDPAGLAYEINAHRYHPVPVTVRAPGGGEGLRRLLRTVGAGIRAGSTVVVSVEEWLPVSVQAWMESHGVMVHLEDDAAWLARVSELDRHGGRVRLVDVEPGPTVDAVGASPAVTLYADPVTSAGALELHPYLREQSVSITAHRFGTPRRVKVPAPRLAKEES